MDEVIPKPHLKKTAAGWECRFFGVLGFGPTWQIAYTNWKIRCLSMRNTNG